MKRDFIAVIAVILFLLFGATLAQAQEHQWDSPRMEWSSKQVALGVAALTLNVIDWGQTRHIVQSPNHYETNLLLGKHPSLSDVNRHFLLTTVLIGGLAHFIPQYRTEILSVFVAVQTVNTARNYSIGLRMKF